MTVLLGVDPGSRRTGWGAIEVDGSQLRHLASGTLSAPESWSVERRLARLHAGIVEVLDARSPAEVALERVFAARNVRSALVLGQARGVVLLEVGRRGLELGEYAPAEVKVAVTGSGRATKDQVRAMVERLLAVDLRGRTDDCADALALAICHAHGRRRRRLVEKARGSSAGR